MALMARKSSGVDYELAPEGTQQAVCVDVVDLGHHPNPFTAGKTQHKVLVVWQLETLKGDGARRLAHKRYTLSLEERAILRHDLESWRGKHFTDHELEGFDVESVIGANALLNIIHQKNDGSGKTYANIASVSSLARGMVKMKADGYVRPDFIAGWVAKDTAPIEPSDERMLDAEDIPF